MQTSKYSQINSMESQKSGPIEKEFIKKLNQGLKDNVRHEEIRQKAFEPITKPIGRVKSNVNDALDQRRQNLIYLQNIMQDLSAVNQFLI